MDRFYGVRSYTVSKLLGHADLKTTMVYAKMGLGTMQAAVDALQKRYELPMPVVVSDKPITEGGEKAE
jgi:sulfopyruvate decarboxylase TPP-binding subunit